MQDRKQDFVRESPEYTPRWYDNHSGLALALSGLAGVVIAMSPLMIREGYHKLQKMGVIKIDKPNHDNIRRTR
jgi:hypothetical protein